MSHIGGDTDNHKNKTQLIPTKDWGSDVLVSVDAVKRNLLDVKKRIAPCKLRIIGVTKYYGLSAIISGYEAGLLDFGESRALESVEKIISLPDYIRAKSVFHFIGHLQTNKAEKVVEYFDYIHSVDSLKLARVISKAACSLNKRVKILLQVNNANEGQKFGYSKEVLREEFLEILSLDGVEVVGLMNIAPLGLEEKELRTLFRDIRELRDSLEREFEVALPELSMGMSNDYEIAVEEGATMIRVGRKLFK